MRTLFLLITLSASVAFGQLSGGGSGGTGSGAAVWGSVTGTLSSQSDLNSALTGKSPLAGNSSLVTVGTITTGLWQGTALADSFVASAATWNAKQAAISGAPGTWPSFATVATSGAYPDLSSKPTIPAPAYTAVTFSTTPAFTVTASTGIQNFAITLTGNVSSSTLVTTSATLGQDIAIKICQDGTGSRTFVWPTNVINPGSIPTSVSTCGKQVFRYDGTNAVAFGGMVSDGSTPGIQTPTGFLSLPTGTGTLATTGSSGVGPSASAYNSATQSLTSNTDTPLTFNVNEWDTCSSCTIHSTSTNPTRFTAPTTGVYDAACGAIVTGNGLLFLSIRINGTAAQNAVPDNSSNANGPAVNVSKKIALTAGDYIICDAFPVSFTATTAANFSWGQLTRVF